MNQALVRKLLETESAHRVVRLSPEPEAPAGRLPLPVQVAEGRPA
jgi:hypothetical protein